MSFEKDSLEVCRVLLTYYSENPKMFLMIGVI